MKIPTEVEFVESDELREDRARSRARRLGYAVKTSTGGKSFDNCGGYMLLNAQNHVVAGGKFDLTLDQLEEWLDKLAVK
ncbi:MAG: hypothetical protein ACLQOQ_15210 [Beijerinckiaceae bacterium]